MTSTLGWCESVPSNGFANRPRVAGASNSARRICRYVAAGPGEPVLGAGFTHPRACVREEHRRRQLDGLGPELAAEYLVRH